MLLQMILPDAAEKITLVAALIIAVIWLSRERSVMNKRRDEDMTLLNEKRENDLKEYRVLFEQLMNRQIEMEKNSIAVIQKNTSVIEQFTEVMEQVKDKLRA